jgi:1,3-beta-glucanosyltransferase GAS1
MPQGSHLFSEKSGTQFFVRGISYQYDGNALLGSVRYSDTLDDGLTCRRDIDYLTNLGMNTILVDWLKPDADHSACMQALQARGIYVLAGLSAPNENIFQTQTWDVDLKKRFTDLIENLAGYSNLLGFFVTGSPITLPFVKAAVRDLRTHMMKRPGRYIPIGYSGLNWGKDLSQALNCGDRLNSIDFLLLDLSPVCSARSSLRTSMELIVEQYSNYSVPILLSTYLCDPKDATNLDAIRFLNDSTSTQVISGTFMFSYFGDSRENTTGKYILKSHTFSTYLI